MNNTKKPLLSDDFKKRFNEILYAKVDLTFFKILLKLAIAALIIMALFIIYLAIGVFFFMEN